MRFIRRAAWPAAVVCLLVGATSCQSTPATTSSAAAPTSAPTFTQPPVIRITPTPIPPTRAPATPTPTADTRLLTTFGPNVNPLTGETVADPAALDRRPLAIKVGDSNEPSVRPQSGVSYADLVFEHETEGGIPRWTAIYLTHTPARVGGNRSCRIIDADLPAIFKSLLVCSGFSGGTREYHIKQTEFYDEGRAISPDFGDYGRMFFRSDAIPPHNLIVVPAEVWAEADRRGVNDAQDLSGMVFSNRPIVAGAPAARVVIPYRGEQAEWRYDPGAELCSSLGGCYLRWSDGVPHTDALNGQQLSAANVVVIYATHVPDLRYLEDTHGAGAYSLQIQVWNDPAHPEQPGGRAQVFRDGQVFEGQWSRPSRFDMLSLLTADGEPIPLKPGTTWFQLVRPDTNIQVQP